MAVHLAGTLLVHSFGALIYAKSQRTLFAQGIQPAGCIFLSVTRMSTIWAATLQMQPTLKVLIRYLVHLLEFLELPGLLLIHSSMLGLIPQYSILYICHLFDLQLLRSYGILNH